MLRGIIAHPRTTIAAALLLTVIGLAALPFFGAGFLPELKEGHFTLHMAAVPGTSIAESQRIGTLVTNALLKLPSVRVISQRIGRAEKADDTWGTHYSEFEVDLKRDLSGEESDEVSEDTVVDELVPGYRLHDRLLRPAIVRVVHPRKAPAAS